MTRLAYTALFFVNALLAMALRAFGNGWLKHLWSFEDCNIQADPNCVGNQAVFRASFAICCFFALVTILSIFSERGHSNFCCLWCFQLPCYVTILVLSFFIPNGFFIGYAWLARITSIFFLVLQIIIIIDFMYNVRDYLIDKIDAAEADTETSISLLSGTNGTVISTPKDNSWIWKSVYLVIVFVALGGALTGIGLLYHYYDSCPVGMTFTTITLVMILISTGISITEWAGTGLMPPSIVAAYAVLLCYQALASNPDVTCNTLLTFDALSTSNTTISAILGAATITWTSWTTSASASAALKMDRTHEMDTTESSKVKPSETPSWQFHLIMVFGGLYMAMVLTQWGSLHGQHNDVNMWVQIVSQWVVLLLYLWTLIAPRLLLNREFVV
ncbi:hypothetical protein THRCLA_04983 [Thraustotheca clavata]|uniref:Serine incorporator n=1 Tax=Thraustotheca clavata TaxID=74557 RepID=A0A1V9ZXD2_9STRA|nr:hypothetical protein THRCLA_04983 [Thraustotheca clavata]